MFYRLSKEKRHTHIALIDEAGNGQSSEDMGHSHSIQMGVVVPTDHTHEITEEIQGKVKKPSEKEADIVANVKCLFKTAVEDESDSRKAAEESDKFYRGGKHQWKRSDKEELEGDKRPALTFNEIEAKIDLLSGYQRQNRLDMRFFPVEDGDTVVADILTELAKNINEQCNFDHEETKVFEDEMIPGRGIFHTYVDYEADIRGVIKTEKFPWMDAYFGPHEKEDLSDCEHAHKARWFSKGKCKQMWPEKAKNIERTFDLLESDKELKGYPTDGYEHPDTEVPIAGGADPEFVNIARKEIRVIESTYKEYEQVTVLSIPDLDIYHPAQGWKKEDIAAAKTIPGISAINRKITRFRVSIIGGDILLDDYYDETLEDFSLTPVYAKKRGNYWWGKVEAAKDPQREINKRRSQLADMTNRVSGRGWFYDDQTFPGAKEERDFKKNSSKAGFTAKITDVTRPPHREDGPNFPVEIANSIALDSQKIREIMNVNLAMIGDTQQASGVALARSERQGVIGNEFLFDNLSLAKRLLGRKLIKLIQKVYTPERIMRVISNRSQRQNIEIGGEKYGPDNPLNELQQAAIMQLLETTDLSQYDVVAGEMVMSPTMRLAYFSMFSEMAAKGAPIPPTLIIKLSPLPEKEKQEALAEILRMQQMQQNEQQTKYDMEIKKTLIAHQGKQGDMTGAPPDGAGF